MEAHVRYASVLAETDARPLRRLAHVRGAVLEHIRESHGQVEALYRIESEVGFEPGARPHPDAVRFAARRLGAGGAVLRDLWWTAWRAGAGR